MNVCLCMYIVYYEFYFSLSFYMDFLGIALHQLEENLVSRQRGQSEHNQTPFWKRHIPKKLSTNR